MEHGQVLKRKAGSNFPAFFCSNSASAVFHGGAAASMQNLGTSRRRGRRRYQSYALHFRAEKRFHTNLRSSLPNWARGQVYTLDKAAIVLDRREDKSALSSVDLTPGITRWTSFLHRACFYPTESASFWPKSYHATEVKCPPFFEPVVRTATD